MPNSDVIFPYLNAADVTGRSRGMWIVDFGAESSLSDAAGYVGPLEHVKEKVLPARRRAKQQKARDQWWLHWCPRPQLRGIVAALSRFIGTPRVSKHRVFLWLAPPAYSDCALVVFARSDDYFFGVLHSRLHEVWARAQGTQLRERESGFRYTPTTCFETFPFPEPTPEQEGAIAEAAAELDRLRSNWLNPPEWTAEEVLEFPGSVDGPWARYVYYSAKQRFAAKHEHDSDDRGIGTVRYPRLVPADAECAKKLKSRTLTNLYNQRPTWLDLAHRKLDQAVFAAYAWPPDMSDDQILEKLLDLNLRRHAAEAGTR